MATCTMVAGTRTRYCLCPEGTIGTGLICSPIDMAALRRDRCSRGNGGCDLRATCTPDGCLCPPGMSGNGWTCTDMSDPPSDSTGGSEGTPGEETSTADTPSCDGTDGQCSSGFPSAVGNTGGSSGTEGQPTLNTAEGTAGGSDPSVPSSSSASNNTTDSSSTAMYGSTAETGSSSTAMQSSSGQNATTGTTANSDPPAPQPPPSSTGPIVVTANSNGAANTTSSTNSTNATDSENAGAEEGSTESGFDLTLLLAVALPLITLAVVAFACVLFRRKRALAIPPAAHGGGIQMSARAKPAGASVPAAAHSARQPQRSSPIRGPPASSAKPKPSSPKPKQKGSSPRQRGTPPSLKRRANASPRIEGAGKGAGAADDHKHGPLPPNDIPPAPLGAAAGAYMSGRAVDAAEAGGAVDGGVVVQVTKSPVPPPAPHTSPMSGRGATVVDIPSSPTITAVNAVLPAAVAAAGSTASASSSAVLSSTLPSISE